MKVEWGLSQVQASAFYTKIFPPIFLKQVSIGLKEEIRKAREKTLGVIGVNVMVAMTNFTDMIKTAISEKVDLITAGAGLPLDLPSFLKKDSITKLIPIVSSARAAKIICEKWKANYDYLPDAIIVEGPKAGGHLGFKEDQIFDNDYSLEKLVPEIMSELKMFEEKYGRKIPLIAAGGIYTGEDIHKIILTRSFRCSDGYTFCNHRRVRCISCFQTGLYRCRQLRYRDNKKSGRNAGKSHSQQLYHESSGR